MEVLLFLEKKLATNARQHFPNVTMLALSSIFSSLAGLAVTILFANYLSKESFGNYRYILGLINVFNSFALSGMNSAVMQAVAKGYDGTLKAAITYQLKWALLHSVIGLIAGSIFYLRGELLSATCLFFISIILPTSNAFNTYTAFLQGKKDFKSFSLFTTLQSFIVYSSIAIATIFTQNVVMITVANISATLIINVVLHYYTVNRYKPSEKTDAQAVTYGRNLSVLWGLRLATDQIETFLIYSLLGPIQLAVFTVIITIPERLKGFMKIGPSIVFPDYAQRTLVDIVPPLRKKIALSAIILMSVSICYYFLSPSVFRLIYPLYTDIIPFAQIYGISFVFGLNMLPMSILMAQRSSKELEALLIVSSIIQLVCITIGVLSYGLPGAVLGKMTFLGLQLIINQLMLEYTYNKQRKHLSKT